MATGLRTLLATLLLCLPPAAAAEALPDPTRPAIDLTGGAEGGTAPAEAAPRGLQSTIISPQYRAAIINGETVRLGGKSGDSRLVEVRENSVILQDARGRRRLMELFPQVSIKKNKAAQKGAGEQVPAQPGLPEKDVGGVK